MKSVLAVAILVMLVAAYLLGIVPGITDPFFVAVVALLVCSACVLLRMHKHQALAKLMLSTFAVLTLVVVLDLSLRPMVDSMTFYRPHERFAKFHDKYPQLLRYRSNVDFTGKTYGDLAAMSGRPSLREPRTVRFCTDRYGFRNYPEVASDAPFSLLVMGDSVAVGNGVNQDNTWAALLRSQYHHRLYNLSQVGNVYGHLLDFQLELPRLRLSTNAICLLVVFSGNDLNELYDSRLRIDEIPTNSRWDTFMQRWQSVKRRSAIRRLISMNRAVSAPGTSKMVVCFGSEPEIAFYRPYIEAASRSTAEVRAQANFAPLMATMDMFRDLVAKNGFTFAVVYMPSKEEIYSWVVNNSTPASFPYSPSAFDEILRDYCASNGISYCDLSVPLSEKARELWRDTNAELLWWRDDTHLNNAGNAVAAEFLNSFLATLGSAPR